MISPSSDWIELLRGLNAALGNYGAPRATGDLDIWIDRTPENARIVYQVLADFGAPLGELSVDDLQSDDLVFDISGVTFPDAWEARASGRAKDLADIEALESG